MRWFLAGLSGLERLRAEGWRVAGTKSPGAAAVMPARRGLRAGACALTPVRRGHACALMPVRRGHACPPADSALYARASTPIVIRGEAAGLSQRRISSSSLTGNVTQPAVGVPMLMCRKMALPSPGVRAVLYAITVP
jgi:hypothetical protein